MNVFTKRNKTAETLIEVGVAIIVGTLAVFLGGWVVKVLWNAVIPYIFSLPTLDYFQALFLYGLCYTLFGGSGCRKSSTN